jgi:GT2 family glycosyltransferase
MNPPNAGPLISVIVLNYNGANWLERCLESLARQTIFSRLEILVADNNSPDQSAQLAERIMQSWPKGRVIQHGENLGFSEGNNRAAAAAQGRYLFFLNNDTWLEPDCLEKLMDSVGHSHVVAACPLILNYEGDSFQSLGAGGFDICGLATARQKHQDTQEVLMPEGCAYLIERDRFAALGGFDPEFFMFAEEYDLSWRVWLSGGRAESVPSAKLHHRGAAQVNPQGGGQVTEIRTSDTKRFYANRNNLLVLLKNGQHVLLLLIGFQLMLLVAEMAAALVILRRWGFVKRAYLGAIADCWRLRKHILAERRRICQLRKRSDWWMLRFLRARLNRWDELQRLRRYGLPKVTPR